MTFFKMLLFSALVLTAPQLFKKDFKVPPVYREIPYNPDWDMQLCDPSILAQNFTYLTHGNQSTIFVSEDGKYVLKIFRYNRTRFHCLHKLKALFRQKPKNDLFTKINKTLCAAHLACTEAKDLTEAIYAHLNITQNKLPTIPLGSEKIQLDRVRFILQKKVAPFKETLLSTKDDPEKMRELLHSWAKLIEKRVSCGIRNADPNLGPNFGFLEGKAVEIDFGNYRKSPQLPEEIDQYFIRFEHFLLRHAPEYIDYLKELQLKYFSSYDPDDEPTQKLHRPAATIN
jgi:hypothetical protein